MSVFDEIEIVGRYTFRSFHGEVRSLWLRESPSVRVELGQLVRSTGYAEVWEGELGIVVKIRNPATSPVPIWDPIEVWFVGHGCSLPMQFEALDLRPVVRGPS